MRLNIRGGDTLNSILICDDEKDIPDMLSMFFRSREYRTMTAGSGQEAFEQIEKQPDIILLITKLPQKEFDIVALLTDKKVQQIINDFPVRNFSEGLDAKYTYNNSIQSFLELSQVKVFGGLTATK